MYTVYILYAQKLGRFYVRHTIDLADRLARHNTCRSKATKPGAPWQIVHSECFDSKCAAVRREQEIKSWKSSIRIRNLIESIPSSGTGG